MIVDYSFWGLNNKTMKLAPEGAMQFGTAPLRIREALMKANPDYGPVYMYKNDMSDGFYRIRLSTTGALKLGVILPRFEGLPQLVALPLVLPMGWTESPPWFCAFTETVADLTNVDLQQNKRVPPHPLGRAAAITNFEVRDTQVARPIPKSHQPLIYQRPLKKMEVFVDNFVGMDQDHPSNPLTSQRAVVSHNIDKVFQPNRPTDNQWRKEPQSQSKMAKGDASWHTIKEALGWNWGATTKTLQLKEKRVSKALSLLGEVLDCKRVSTILCKKSKVSSSTIQKWSKLTNVIVSIGFISDGMEHNPKFLFVATEHSASMSSTSDEFFLNGASAIIGFEKTRVTDKWKCRVFTENIIKANSTVTIGSTSPTFDIFHHDSTIAIVELWRMRRKWVGVPFHEIRVFIIELTNKKEILNGSKGWCMCLLNQNEELPIFGDTMNSHRFASGDSDSPICIVGIRGSSHRLDVFTNLRRSSVGKGVNRVKTLHENGSNKEIDFAPVTKLNNSCHCDAMMC
ncbi:unnamed protein product [Cylindrotheca closterium]|uniref:Uncharacterized protein n=1 Tax=Cylindrotheca closterium TaxID=2856 RepID=A0AAD2FYW0_9STRA|nr:unnamed protein product [Cylindrotheca closterium]